MYNYTTKVKDKVFLWGSDNVFERLDFSLFLTIHNDPYGDEIRIFKFDGSSDTDMGALRPGECWTVPLSGLHGVYGLCDTDSAVNCVVAGLR